MLAIWSEALRIVIVLIVVGISCTIGDFIVGLRKHIYNKKVVDDGFLKGIWLVIGILAVIVFIVGLVVSACTYFQKSWEHINQEHIVSHLSLYNCRIDSGSVRVESSKNGFYADFTGGDK